jgi:transcriptional regulator with XRE-family HTH domain
MDEKRITKVRHEGPIYFSRPVRADGRTLRELREERGLSVSELARLSGVSTSTIYKLQRGPASRTGAERNYTLKRLAEALEVEVERLEA